MNNEAQVYRVTNQPLAQRPMDCPAPTAFSRVRNRERAAVEIAMIDDLMTRSEIAFSQCSGCNQQNWISGQQARLKVLQAGRESSSDYEPWPS